MNWRKAEFEEEPEDDEYRQSVRLANAMSHKRHRRIREGRERLEEVRLDQNKPDMMQIALSQAASGEVAAKRVVVVRAEEDKDPVKWVRAVHFKIESKEYGLIDFDPWPHQCYDMRQLVAGKGGVRYKGAQTGETTGLMAAAAHQLLFGQPFHCHVFAHLEDVAIKRCLQIVRVGLGGASLPAEQLERLELGGYNSAQIRYSNPSANNYLRAHAASMHASRGYDGNCFILDEAAWMPYARGVYTRVASLLADGVAQAWIVSTPNGAGDFFYEMVMKGEERGFEVIKMDWRAHPGRDEIWKAKSQALFEGSIEEWEQEHECKFLSSGEMAFDMQAIEQFSSEVEWIGSRPNPLHRYAKGIDQSAGMHDKTIFVAIDITMRPAQVVKLAEFMPDANDEKKRTEQKIEFMENMDAQYPGMTHIDGTNEKGIVALLRMNRKVPVHLTGGSMRSLRKDKGEQMEWHMVPRNSMIDQGATNLGTGRVICHLDQFPQLYDGLRTARKSVSANLRSNVRGSSKREGLCVDELDAFLLADLALAPRRQGPPVTTIVQPGIPRAQRARQRW